MDRYSPHKYIPDHAILFVCKNIGKGESGWDFWSHENNGSNIADGKNGDIACDSYNVRIIQFDNDIQQLFLK